MKSIEKILAALRRNEKSDCGEYYIPQKWNYFGYEHYTVSSERPGEIGINPYDFFTACLEKFFTEPQAAVPKAVPITQNIIYAMMPRIFTAWPHGDKKDVCLGTFLKCIALLPLLKQYSVDIVYLLPVFKCSEKYKKGELGSPYSARDIYRIDENLHDPLLSGMTPEEEFRAFVEVCHSMGMRVMVDFVFRTVARDSDLVYEHPDWFYWIGSKGEEKFHTPVVETAKKSLRWNNATLKLLYTSESAKAYLDAFTQSPDKLAPEQWAGIEKSYASGKNCFDDIVEKIGVTTVPGFSDVINDAQPPWTDVTYLRFYYDNHSEAQKYLKPGQNPYIMQDGASLNIYHGKEKNIELWDYIAGVIPFYENEYSIDGARIDMAHALPAELSTRIIREAKQCNKNFILWSEEFDPKKGRQAAQDGFSFISGFVYSDYKKVATGAFNRSILQKSLLASEIPMTAAPETADTPRTAFIQQDDALLRVILALSSFLPNSVPLLSNGIELHEIQPMNLGLDNTEEGRYVLPKTDPMYGKLCFFDRYCLHWTQDDRGVGKVLHDTLILRKRFSKLLGDRDNFCLQPELFSHHKITILCYTDGKNVFFVLANRDTKHGVRIKLDESLPQKALSVVQGGTVPIVYDNGLCSGTRPFSRTFLLGAGEVLVGTGEA